MKSKSKIWAAAAFAAVFLAVICSLFMTPRARSAEAEELYSLEDYLDSDNLLLYKSVTIQDYADSIVTDYVGHGTVGETFKHHSECYIDSDTIGTGVIATDDDPIVQIIPRKYFTEVCTATAFGNDYGFFIKTELVDSQLYSHVMVMDYEFEDIGTVGVQTIFKVLFQTTFTYVTPESTHYRCLEPDGALSLTQTFAIHSQSGRNMVVPVIGALPYEHYLNTNKFYIKDLQQIGNFKNLQHPDKFYNDGVYNPYNDHGMYLRGFGYEAVYSEQVKGDGLSVEEIIELGKIGAKIFVPQLKAIAGLKSLLDIFSKVDKTVGILKSVEEIFEISDSAWSGTSWKTNYKEMPLFYELESTIDKQLETYGELAKVLMIDLPKENTWFTTDQYLRTKFYYGTDRIDGVETDVAYWRTLFESAMSLTITDNADTELAKDAFMFSYVAQGENDVVEVKEGNNTAYIYDNYQNDMRFVAPVEGFYNIVAGATAESDAILNAEGAVTENLPDGSKKITVYLEKDEVFDFSVNLTGEHVISTMPVTVSLPAERVNSGSNLLQLRNGIIYVFYENGGGADVEFLISGGNATITEMNSDFSDITESVVDNYSKEMATGDICWLKIESQSATITLTVTARKTLYFVANNGTATESAVVVNDGGFTFPQVTKYGYRFLGWNTSDEEPEDSYLLTDEIMALNESSVTLYAQWGLIIYNATLICDNETGASENIEFSVFDEVQLPEATKTGYNFAGWYTNSQFTGSAITVIEEGTDNDITFYAKWNPITYYIQLDLNYDNAPASQIAEVEYGSDNNDLSSFTPENREGYDFGGWRIGNLLYFDEFGESVRAWNIANDTTLYAVWNLETYTVTYVTNGGTLNSDAYQLVGGNYKQNYTIESPTISLPVPVRNHYNFKGWYTNSALTVSAPAAIPSGSFGNKMFYAKWENKVYTLYFSSDDGFSDSITAVYGQNVTLLSLSREFHTGQWRRTSDNTMFNFGANYYCTGTETFKAVLTLIDGYFYKTSARDGTFTVEDKGQFNNSCDYTVTIESKTALFYSKVRIAIYFTAWEKDDGYQHVYIYNGGSSSATQLAHWEFEHGGSKKDGNPAEYVYEVEVPISQVSGKEIYVRYDASGAFSDTWYNNSFGCEVFLLV